MGYPGNKSHFGSYQQIINQFPPHENFISLCAGSGSIEKIKLLSSKVNLVYEISKNVVNQYWSNVPGYIVINGSFFDNLNRLANLHGQTLIYADPPYKLDSRRNGRLYYDEEWNDEMHDRFLRLCISFKCMVAISHYQCEMYDKALTGWRRIEWQVMTHRGPRMESLYMNYPEPTELHQYNFLGTNFTDRQRIRRKTERWYHKLKTMKPLERYAILNAIERLRS